MVTAITGSLDSHPRLHNRKDGTLGDGRRQRNSSLSQGLRASIMGEPTWPGVGGEDGPTPPSPTLEGLVVVPSGEEKRPTYSQGISHGPSGARTSSAVASNVRRC